jgi:hypothetical protein
MSPQIINSDLGLYRYFNTASSLFRNSLISPEGALYIFNIISVVRHHQKPLNSTKLDVSCHHLASRFPLEPQRTLQMIRLNCEHISVPSVF